MNKQTQLLWSALLSADIDARYQAYLALKKATETPVDWAYGVWELLLEKTRDKDNHMRTIAAQLLCNLAISDPKKRMLKDFDAIMAVTHDPRFVTARHTLQASWRVGLAGSTQRKFVLTRLAERFETCAAEKNCTLIRYDICVALRCLFDATGDIAVKTRTLALIDTEAELKYRKKYAMAWR